MYDTQEICYTQKTLAIYLVLEYHKNRNRTPTPGGADNERITDDNSKRNKGNTAAAAIVN